MIMLTDFAASIGTTFLGGSTACPSCNPCNNNCDCSTCPSCTNCPCNSCPGNQSSVLSSAGDQSKDNNRSGNFTSAQDAAVYLAK